MEIPLLFFMLFVAAIILGESRANYSALKATAQLAKSEAPVAVEPSEPLEIASPLIELPRARVASDEQASRGEMLFAGQYLNFAGLAMLTVGLMNYIKVSGITQRVTSGGWLQCLLGAAFGVGLSLAGEQAFRQGRRAYAQPLLAAGICILFLTVAASHFYFHILPAAGLVLAVFGLVAWAGLTVIRYDSWLIGASILGAVFLGPAVMTFSLNSAGLMLGYLLAVNLATTVVAYYKKWDSFLIASFLGSYLLYFSKFGFDRPWTTLAFLGSTYLMFLVSGNLFHFLRRTASDFDLWLSLINPLAFACASYPTLLLLPNSVSLTTYALIGALHLGLVYLAQKQRGQGQAYLDMAQTHLSLGLLFVTASISFLTYCSRENTFFGPVTLLWIAQAAGLLWGSFRLDCNFSTIVRRSSYLTMILAAIQLVYVIPTMAEPYFVELPAVLALLAYFRLNESGPQTQETRLVSNLTLIAAIGAVQQSMMADLFSLTTLLAGSALAPILLLGYRRYPETLAAFRWLAPIVGGLVTLAILWVPWPAHIKSLCLVSMAALLGGLTPIAMSDEKLEKEAHLGALLGSVVLLRACWVVRHFDPSLALLLAAFVGLAQLELSRKMKRLEPAALAIGMLVGLAGLTLEVSGLAQWSAYLAVIGCFARAYQVLQKESPDLVAGPVAAAGLLLLKMAWTIDSGVGSTLIWSLLGMAMLMSGRSLASLAQVTLMLSFVKSIVFDSNFIFRDSGMQMSATGRPELVPMVLVACTVAVFLKAASLSREQAEWKGFFTLQAQVVFAFQVTALLYRSLGPLDNFQIILSGFWVLTSVLLIAGGIHAGSKLFRLFGLVVMVSSVAKIYAVDIWVLDAYDKSTTTLVLGATLMLVSFLYQLNRNRLTHNPLEQPKLFELPRAEAA